jgi:phospholipid/cholesterol/gamma-HCH transport system permease protein
MVASRHIFVGLAYAVSFGVIIGLCGCYQGIRCGRSAEAVGKAATMAVVSSVVCIIVATAIITVLCTLLRV